MAESLRIRAWHRTGLACPAQWEGELDDGRAIYLRYRMGVLRIHVAESIEEAVAAPPVLRARCGNDLKPTWTAAECRSDGYLDENELRAALPDWLQPPSDLLF